jgi:hypothetical protein
MEEAITHQWDSTERLAKLGLAGTEMQRISPEISYAAFLQHLETAAANYDTHHKSA